jgi:hypothetical protein
MAKFFIEATGPFVYNKTGVVYPFSNPCNFGSVLVKHGIKKRSWAKRPNDCFKVLCFAAEAEPNFGDDLPFGLKISERNWK